MSIVLNNVVPDFLEEEKIAGSQIWNNNISIKKGESIQIVAPSGSGKTSLIHFLYGLRKDYSGNIFIDDKDLNNFSAEDHATCRSKKISIVFQDLRLFLNHTVLQNLEIKRALSPYDDASKINAMAERLAIASKLGKPAGTCSYGEQQRIAIIRALMQPFDFLLMDEPFSHLDELNRQKAMQLVEEEAAERNASIILADLQQREYFKSDRIFYL